MRAFYSSDQKFFKGDNDLSAHPIHPILPVYILLELHNKYNQNAKSLIVFILKELLPRLTLIKQVNTHEDVIDVKDQKHHKEKPPYYHSIILIDKSFHSYNFNR